ncbi:MAG: hypothetical protein ABL860_06420 [Candidatus Nitrotoga sp.]
MHSNAANTQRFSYAAIFGRGGSFARHRVKLLMTALMILGMATQAQAEGTVVPSDASSFLVNGTAYSSRVDACQALANHKSQIILAK